MKFDSNNKVIEMMNYRNKIFEYKHIKIIDHETFYISHYADNKNPNESNLYFEHTYFKSNIIEDYRITIFIVERNISNNEHLFLLYNNDESLKILKALFTINEKDSDKKDLIFTTTDINTTNTIETDLILNKKGLICISWNGINSAVYINGKKIYTFTHSGVGSSTSKKSFFSYI